jgi:hypothetical protein
MLRTDGQYTRFRTYGTDRIISILFYKALTPLGLRFVNLMTLTAGTLKCLIIIVYRPLAPNGAIYKIYLLNLMTLGLSHQAGTRCNRV